MEIPVRLLVDSPLQGDFEELVSYLAQKGYIDRNYADSDDEWSRNSYSLTVDGRSEYEDVTQDQRFTSTDEKPDQVSDRPRSRKTGPKPIADSHYQNLFSALREYGQSDEWADERNLKTVCRQLDQKNISVPKKWQRVESRPASWDDRKHGPKHGAKTPWSEALKHGGKTPVAKVLRSRQKEALNRASPCVSRSWANKMGTAESIQPSRHCG